MKIRRAVLAAGIVTMLVVAAASSVEAQTVIETGGPPRGETKWVVDMVHSQVGFGVRHLVGRVRGSFTKWYAVLSTENGGWNVGNVNVSIQTASLSTGNNYRDADLRSDRFFAVNRYPQMTFQGSGFAATDSTVDVHGLLTIKGHSRPVLLTGEYRGIAKDAEGRERIAFEVSTVVDRRDYGLAWNESIAGTPLIGDEVEVTVGIEAVRVN
jgi:polyisoprenoid-binding protein YceI